jgi:RNA polymerase sigma-70 factor (ECF subfamily)
MDSGFKQNLLACRDSAYHLALRMTCNAADAEDVVQDAFVRAIRFSASAPDGNDLRKWFLHIVANAARDKRSSETRRREMERNSTMQTGRNNEALPVDLKETLARLLSELDEKFRLPIALHYEQGMTHAEAAEILQIPHSTVRVYAARGLEILREQLARRGHSAEPAVIVALLGTGMKLTAPAALSLAVEKIVASGLAPAGKAVGAASGALAWKLALIGFACLAVGIFVVSTRFVPGKAPVSPSVAFPAPVAEARGDETSATPSENKELAAILNKKVDVNYKRSYLKEILADLEEKSGLKCAFPISLGTTMLTLESKEISVREVLEKLSAEGLQVEFHDKTVVFWKRDSDEAFSALETKLKSADAHARCEAVCDLSPLASRRACNLLLSAQNDSDAKVKMWAVFSLNNFRNALRFAEPPAALAAKLLKDLAPAGQYRAAQIRLLGATASPEAESTLIEALKTSDVAQAEAAAEMLKNYRSKEAVDALIARIGDKDAGIREEVSHSLSVIGDIRALKPLLDVLNKKNLFITEAADLAQFEWKKIGADIHSILAGDNKNARANVPLVLACIRDEGRQDAWTMLKGLLKDADSDVRMKAGCAIQYSGNPESDSVLIEFLEQETNNEAKTWAIDALANTHTQKSAQWLIDYLPHCDRQLLPYATRALGETRDDRALSVLMQSLQSTESEIRDFAIMGLVYNRSAASLEAEIAGAKSADAAVRWDATIGLSRSVNINAIDGLLTFIENADKKWKPAVAAYCAKPYLCVAPLDMREKLKAALDAFGSKSSAPKAPPKPPSNGDF